MSDQMIFKRYEIKYMLNRQQLAIIKEAMSKHMKADHFGKHNICSLYFDTPNFLLIRRSIEHPIYKEKLRLRSYGTAKPDSGIFIELKKKYDSVVYKRRVSMTEQEAMNYLLHNKKVMDSQITREIDYCMNFYEELAPAVMLSYEREAYYGIEDPEFRVTFDDKILWRDYDLSLCSGIYGTPLLPPDKILMEVKTAGAIPLWFTEILTQNHIYKTSFSKYGTAYRTIFENKRNGGIYHYA